MREFGRYITVGLAASLLVVGLGAPAFAASPVEVVALFKDRAVVRTTDGQQMLKLGETSKFGVTLLAADPHGARVHYRGEVYEVSLTTRVGSVFAQPNESALRINKDNLGQYRTRGAVNGHYVNFLVDTGASVVAMSETHARGIGLDYTRGEPGQVHTAQGSANAYFVELDSVEVGGIRRSGVRATVIEGGYPIDVLLGMSFLSKVRMVDDEGVLTMTAKY